METIILEDEYPAAERLREMIAIVDPQINVKAILGSVSEAENWFQNNPPPDLIFSDIQLSDGLAFYALEKAGLKTAIIFTTSFDQYAIRAFKLNSLDYLLKPIKQRELKIAIEKYKELFSSHSLTNTPAQLQGVIELFLSKVNQNYKEKFVVRQKDQLIAIGQREIAYFFTTNEMVFLKTRTGHEYLIDNKLEDLERVLDRKRFFRLNRKFVARDEAIKKIHIYFNKRLKIELDPPSKEEVIISKEKTPLFRKWLEGSLE